MESPEVSVAAPLARAVRCYLGPIPELPGLFSRAQALLEIALSVTGAEHASLTVDPAMGAGQSFFAKSAAGSSMGQDDFSRTVVERVFALKREVISDDAVNEGSVFRSPSVQRLEIRSLAAVPLKMDDRILAVLCTDHRKRAFAFTPMVIDSLRTLAMLAAPYIRLAIMEEDLQREAKPPRPISARAGRTPQPKPGRIPPPPEMIFKSRAMSVVKAEALRVAKGREPVLIVGQTGTGKELIARLIAATGFPATAPWAAVNCAVLGTTAESELFGHVRGAFTGAERARLGKFRFCNGGVLFLDEITRLSLEVQGMLLRVVEERLVTPKGSEQGEFVSVRLICATSAEPEAEVAAGRFLPDLLYRIGVHRICLPPLAERSEDILPIVRAFFSHHRPAARLSASGEATVRRLPWPGNVRQLQNVLKNLILLDQSEYSEEEIVRFYECTGGIRVPSSLASLEQKVQALKRSEILRALEMHEGNVAAAARELGELTDTLRKKMRALGLSARE